MMHKKIKLSVLLFLFAAQAISAQDELFKPGTLLNKMNQVADWQLQQWDTGGYSRPRYDWVYAAAYTGLMALSAIEKDKRYTNYLLATGKTLGWNTGIRRFHADDYCVAQMYCQLYLQTKDETMISAFRQQADSLLAAPHTESLEWKNNIVDQEWAWCDALFMAPPALGYLTKATGNNNYLNLAIKLWWKTTDYLYDSAEHLFFRDQNYFTRKENNGQKIFWSRGNGWVMAGLVRMLESMPVDHPDRERLIRLYKDMVKRITALQQTDGSWHASLLDPESYPVKESSGTGFYTYALAWGINHKILKKRQYLPVVQKAWRALVSCVHEDGKLGYVQPIGSSPNKTDSNTTDAYGVGAFLLAGSQVYKLMLK
jgi:rhamnogalacturonyl hydrolase YesR